MSGFSNVRSGRDRSYFAPGKNGRGVLLVHGLTGAPGEMKYLAKKLNRDGYAIAAPQLAGHGQDQRALLRTGWRDWLDSLNAATDRLFAETDSVSVAGICVGGALGLLLARERPQIASAAVYSMTFHYDGWNMKPWYRISTEILQHVAHLPALRRISFAEPYPFGLKDERLREMAARKDAALIEGALDRLPMGALHEMYRLGRHLESVGPEIRTPTLILHARDDDMSDPRNAYRLRDALGGPVHVELLDDSYHMIHVDNDRDRVAALTAGFFRAPAASLSAAAPVDA